MAIIIPDECKNTTAGALQQVKQTGHTTAGGGFMAKNLVVGLVQSTSGYTSKREPLGKFMSALEKAKDDIEATTDAVTASARRMVETAEEANQGLAASSRKMRESTEKLAAQMTKFSTIFVNARFDEQAKALQSLADAMERLAALEDSGRLSRVMDAVKGQK